MPEHQQYQEDDLFNPETHHESSDVPVRPLWTAVILFIILGALTHFIVLGLYKVFAKGERSRMDAPQTQVERPADAYVPQNQPLLQPFPQGGATPHQSTPVADLAVMREAEQKTLETYGWVDKDHGVVHIPIEEAKKRFVAQQTVAAQEGQHHEGGNP